MTPARGVRTLDLAAEPELVRRARELVPCLKALADEHRLVIMLLLASRPHTVRELTDATGLSQTLASHHLAALREAGLVAATPRGRANVYQLCCDQLAAPVQLLASLAAITPESAQAPSSDPEETS